PLVDSDALGPALAPVAMIETQIELLLGVAEVGQELWRVLVPRGPHRAFVDGELGHWYQRPLAAVHPLVELAVERYGLQLSVEGVIPTRIMIDRSGRCDGLGDPVAGGNGRDTAGFAE